MIHLVVFLPILYNVGTSCDFQFPILQINSGLKRGLKGKEIFFSLKVDPFS